MVKRILCVVMTVVFLLSSIAVAPVFAEDASSMTNGYTDVLFSNDYRGFCLDQKKKGAYTGDVFTPVDTSIATSNVDGSDVSQKIKILLTQSFDELYKYDDASGYILSDTNTVQAVVWNFTDGQYIWGLQKTLVERVNAYTGPAIPDNGYVLTLANGDTITFYFLVMKTRDDAQQDFFAYKIVTNEKPSHKCEFTDKWEYDEDSHWHECECGEIADEDEHTGGEATCKEKAECEFCGQPYGEKDPENHVGETYVKDAVEPSYEAPGYTGDIYCSDCDELLEYGEPIDQLHRCDFSGEWEYDEDSHWHECECGETADESKHTGGEATCKEKAECEYCGQPYGEKNPENHVGKTYVKDAVEPSYEAPGYTGDIYCSDCDELLEYGEPIDQLHRCDFSDEWEYDEDSHWHECECGEIADESKHTGGEATCQEKAVCDDCGQPYGEIDPDNHSFSEEWEHDENTHWHECECGEITDEDEHTGGEATCIEKAVCEVCHESYGDVDSENHTGDVYVVGVKEPTYDEPGYTGDTHCADCKALIKPGEEIPQLHRCDFSGEWEYDEDSHWHECECGEIADESEHTGGEATCKEKAECEYCGQPYGEKDPENHVGETYVKDAVEPSYEAPGYTGDTYCADCDELLEYGEPIDQLHRCDFSDEWEYDEDLHWHECECGEIADEDEHTGGEATCKEKAECEYCGQPYGEKNPENHVGKTYVKDAVEPSYEAPGYTGDIYCSDCDELLEYGEPIDQLHRCDFSGEWEYDENSHWHECECGEIADEDEHTGGEATCKEKAECEYCGQPYGEKDPENHVGETYVKDAVEPSYEAPGYTGDTYCADCDELLEYGEPIDQLHKHVFSDEWKSDGESHWYECECGEKSEKVEHVFVKGSCTECETQDPEYKEDKPTVPPADDDTNPGTGDNIMIYMCLVISFVIIGTVLFKRKSLNQK